jgi:hypothetical protein
VDVLAVSTFIVEPIDESRYPEFPWSSLDANASPQMMAARHFWSENAFNEYASSLAMTQMNQALIAADAPLSAASFVEDERTHHALCCGVAVRCGGGVAIPYHPASLQLKAEGSPRERATELVVRVCCLGEAVSLPLLSGNLRSARQPLARAVLERIVRDETRHARFGWDYLEWARPDEAERQKLAAIINDALAQLRPMLEGEGGAADGGGLGWMSPREWRALARQSIEQALIRPLARHGIVVQLMQSP